MIWDYEVFLTFLEEKNLEKNIFDKPVPDGL